MNLPEMPTGTKLPSCFVALATMRVQLRRQYKSTHAFYLLAGQGMHELTGLHFPVQSATMRVKLVGHFKPCMTEIYLPI